MYQHSDMKWNSISGLKKLKLWQIDIKANSVDMKIFAQRLGVSKIHFW